MKPRYLLWQKRMKEHPYFIGVVVAVTVIVFFFLSYRLSWDWTGFNGADKTDKTLYDWLQLVLVPLALTVFGFYLNYREKNKEVQRIEKEQKEEARRVTYEKKLADERAQEELKLEQQRAKTG